MSETQFETHYFAEIDSTNEEAKRRLNAGTLTAPAILRAESQTAGRGTQGRRWISPVGAGLYFSIVHPFPQTATAWENPPPSSFSPSEVPPPGAFARSGPFVDSPPIDSSGPGVSGETSLRPEAALTPLLTLAAGVACAEVLRELTQVLVELKPINDLYVRGQKLGGILTESLIGDGVGPARCRGLITGIGINVFEHAAVMDGCQQEQRPVVASQGMARGVNQPTSLQACVPPVIFGQWQGDALKTELALAMAERVDAYYRRLWMGEEALILERYLCYKTPGLDLPDTLRQVLRHAHIAG